MENNIPHNTESYTNYDKDFVHIAEEVKPIDIGYIEKKSVEVKKNSIWKIIFFLLLCLVVISISFALYVYVSFAKLTTPDSIPTTINIAKGTSLQKVTNMLDEKGIISSPFLFRATMILSGLESSIKTGEYTFTKKASMTQVIERLAKGRYEYTPVKLIIREGENSAEIVNSLLTYFPKLVHEENKSQILTQLRTQEGKLFPETYSFAPFDTLDTILDSIHSQYKKRIEKYKADIVASGKTEIEILTIASILEREVPNPKDMKIVSGIIYNRLQKGMPLQMDSTLGYITGKASLELTLDDLKINSPYNTYTNTGLPISPIGNPGDASIDAALHPEAHQYIFFLSDKNGVNHYAENYTKHLQNRKIYLGK